MLAPGTAGIRWERSLAVRWAIDGSDSVSEERWPSLDWLVMTRMRHSQTLGIKSQSTNSGRRPRLIPGRSSRGPGIPSLRR